MSRGQGYTVGVVLLTAVVMLTVMSTGAAVMTEWQSDLDQKPVADIESEHTPDNITVEHRGGDVLYPQNTTLYLTGTDEDIALNEPLKPGTSQSSKFDRPNGTFELLVVYDPQDVVVRLC